jgi:hypothetical protein
LKEENQQKKVGKKMGKSKLSAAFPMEDPKIYLKFANSWQQGIDPVFAGRLAALTKHMRLVLKNPKLILHVSSGLRLTAEQVKLYIKNGGKQLADGSWTGGNGYVAIPGTSFHEYGVAIDTSDQWLKKLEKDLATDLQRTLMKFGLFKPLTKGNGCSVLEDWHIQPIETRGISRFDFKAKKAFLSYQQKDMPTLKLGDKGESVTFLQVQLTRRKVDELKADGNFGQKTHDAVVAFQNYNGLKADGVVNPATWQKLI